MKWLFWPVNPYFLVFLIFFTHTHHTTYSGMHWLLVTTQENERKVRRSLRKRRKTCVTIIVLNRTRNLSIGNRCTYHCTIWDTPYGTHARTPARPPALRAAACPSQVVTAPASDNFHTKVELEFNSSDRSAPKKGQNRL